jgi:hypothetical protein
MKVTEPTFHGPSHIRYTGSTIMSDADGGKGNL